MTLDFLRPITSLARSRSRRPLPPVGWGPMPSPREIEGLRLLRDDQIRWYVSQHGQAFLRRELERRARR